ncbi:hypothetical protein CCAND38_550019 [Capnocytophaga canis]|uniref:Uncharacterized protein n=1 Tax=Capnocytophaga canis TaxID=1848903 RepID=A0A0B7I8Z0_9FLAO|nr:hypothetical protein CCAND38_550019 [Capnocytophaga canis]
MVVFLRLSNLRKKTVYSKEIEIFNIQKEAIRKLNFSDLPKKINTLKINSLFLKFR